MTSLVANPFSANFRLCLAHYLNALRLRLSSFSSSPIRTRSLNQPERLLNTTLKIFITNCRAQICMDNAILAFSHSSKLSGCDNKDNNNFIKFKQIACYKLLLTTLDERLFRICLQEITLIRIYCRLKM